MASPCAKTASSCWRVVICSSRSWRCCSAESCSTWAALTSVSAFSSRASASSGKSPILGRLASCSPSVASRTHSAQPCCTRSIFRCSSRSAFMRWTSVPLSIPACARRVNSASYLSAFLLMSSSRWSVSSSFRRISSIGCVEPRGLKMVPMRSSNFAMVWLRFLTPSPAP